MNRTLRHGVLLTSIIASINLFFLAIASTINQFLIHQAAMRIFFLILASVISASIISFFIVSTSPIFREYLNTFRRLLRLESLSHPLMVRFAHDAPGTYQHTLTVATIAARAAKSIGADSLITRVGAYYHDIGKIINPEFYVENQSPQHNIHDQIENPEESAQIIIKHVQNGVEIAKENHLPQEVINFIQQHHGTSLVNYFYEKGKQEGLKVKKTDFRYPGPKPQTPEIAIVMLADILEAAVRSKPNRTLQDIRETVNAVLEQKIAEGQLDMANLSAKQIAKLRRAFIESLSAIFHQRIPYPSQPKK